MQLYLIGRDPDWIALNKEFTIDVAKAAFVLRYIPAGLRSWVSMWKLLGFHSDSFPRILAPLFRNIPNGIKRGAKHLEPLIRERLEQEAEHGEDWPERPVGSFFITAPIVLLNYFSQRMTS